MTRGEKETAKFLWSEIHFDKYKNGPDIGKRYAKIILDENKTTRYTLDTPVIDPSIIKKEIRETPVDSNDLFHNTRDLYHILCYFKSLCPPK